LGCLGLLESIGGIPAPRRAPLVISAGPGVTGERPQRVGRTQAGAVLSNAARSAGRGVRRESSTRSPLILTNLNHFPKFSSASGERPRFENTGGLAVNGACWCPRLSGLCHAEGPSKRLTVSHTALPRSACEPRNACMASRQSSRVILAASRTMPCQPRGLLWRQGGICLPEFAEGRRPDSNAEPIHVSHCCRRSCIRRPQIQATAVKPGR